MTAWSFTDKFAELAPVPAFPVASPEDPLGYGSDLACDGNDLTADYAERSGSDPLVVVEYFVRMISTPRGSLPDAPGEGVDVRGYLHQGLTQADITALRSMILAQAENDDRIESIAVTVTPEPDGSSIDIEIDGQIVGSEGPFNLVMGVTDAGALIKELTA